MNWRTAGWSKANTKVPGTMLKPMIVVIVIVIFAIEHENLYTNIQYYHEFVTCSDAG